MSLKYKPLPDQATLQALLNYDPVTGSLTWKPRSNVKASWNTRYAGKAAFTATDVNGYHIGALFDSTYRANRVIWKLVTGQEPEQVDHQNGITSDDSWDNLMNVTHTGNLQNMKKSKANKSGVTGVCFNTGKNKWQATIGVDGKSKVLGRFDTMEEAIACRKQGEEFYGYHPNHGR